jgi:multiple sugar transport system substrate-binding protein
MFAAVAILLVFAGCSKKEAAGSSSGGPVEITIWGWNSGTMELIFDEYVRSSGANVKLIYNPVQQSEAFQKLQTVVSAGLEMPQLVPAEASQRGTMIALDIWENLLAAPYNFNREQIFDFYFPTVSNDRGEMVAMPWDVNTAGLAYKKNVAEKYLGTSDRHELQKMLPTWDEFAKVGVKLQADTGGKIFMIASLSSIQQLAYGQNPDPVIRNNVLDMNSAIRPTIQRMVSFRDNKVVDSILDSSPAYSASYADDTHIFYPCAGWTPRYVISNNDPNGQGRWALMLPPEGSFSWGGTAFMIPSKAENKVEAFKFINWITSKEGAAWQYNMSPPACIGSRALYEDPAYAVMINPWFGNQNLGEILFVEAIPTLRIRPVSEYDVTITEIWSLIIENITNNISVGVDTAMKQFETELRNKIPDLK